MSSRPATRSRGPSRITHGAVSVLAYLHERDAPCSEVARETGLSESSTYRWLTELADIGLLEADATRRDNGRPVVVYHLDDDDLGAAAQVLVDRLVAPDPAD